MPRVATHKYYIYVPYKDREEAKKLGAKWDSESKKWFVPNGVNLEKFSKWQYPQKNEIDMNEALEQFNNALRECGFLIDGLPVMDGKIKRAKVEGDRGSEKSGAYVGYTNGYPAGYIENFKTGERVNWKFKLEQEVQVKSLSNAEIEAIKKTNELRAAQRKEEQLRLNEKTAARLKDEYDNAQIAQVNHPYLKAKGIEVQNLRVDRFGNLLIPLSDSDGKIWSVQRIAANGNKIIGVIKTQKERENGEEYSARKKGCFYSSEPLDLHEQFYICEGFATAKSIEILLDKPSIMAVDSGNLINVCEALLEKYPHKQITICADNDLKNEVNTGLNAALKCKEKYPQINVIKPSMADKNISDFNDLMRLKGVAVARADVKSQLAVTQMQYKSQDKEVGNEAVRF